MCWRMKMNWKQNLPVIVVWYATLLVVVAGVSFGIDFLPRCNYNNFRGFLISQPETTFLNGFATWDGVWYAEISTNGYRFNPRQGSHVVFFPLYPACGWAISYLTRCDAVLALVLFSQFVFLADLWLLRVYVRARFPNADELLADQSLLCLGLVPGTLWFRMAYSEGLLLLFVLLFLLGLQQKWSLWWLAVVAGAATGTRAIGVTLSIIWLVEVVLRQVESEDSSHLRTLLRTTHWIVLGGPIAIWGLLAFMAHLWWVFGDPMLFHSNQALFNDMERMEIPWPRRLWDLVTLEPLWSVFVPGSPRYWMSDEPSANPLFSLRFINVPYFCGSVALVSLGWWRGWLNRYDLWLSTLLLLIPYITKGYDNAMLGHARYASVVAPVYLVMGHVLTDCPSVVRQLLAAMSGMLLAFYSALFAAWYIFV